MDFRSNIGLLFFSTLQFAKFATIAEYFYEKWKLIERWKPLAKPWYYRVVIILEEKNLLCSSAGCQKTCVWWRKTYKPDVQLLLTLCFDNS